jgi:hypothetical protein
MHYFPLLRSAPVKNSITAATTIMQARRTAEPDTAESEKRSVSDPIQPAADSVWQ